MISFSFTVPRESAERRVKVGGIASDREEVGLVGMLRMQEEPRISQASLITFKAVRKQKNLTLFLYNQCPPSGLNETLLCPASSPFLRVLVLATYLSDARLAWPQKLRGP